MQNTSTASKSAESTTGTFTQEERAAMKDRAKELRTSGRRSPGPRKASADGEPDVLAKIAEMTDADRALAERLHALVRATAPALSPKLWYGMPAYAKDGKVLCFFQSAQKFRSRYATFGFNDVANLDDGTMWPTAFALTELTAEAEERIRELLVGATS